MYEYCQTKDDIFHITKDYLEKMKAKLWEELKEIIEKR